MARINPDSLKDDHYYARITDYLEFDHPVPLRRGDGTLYESALKTAMNQVSGYAQSAVRAIPDQEFDAIVTAGFGPLLVEETSQVARGFGEAATPFVRPIVEQLVALPFREAAFAGLVKRAYDATCAFTGLGMRNGGGRSEVEAAHIKPVGDGHAGPDSVRNGALSRTVHWMFDRGLLSIDSNYRILTARKLVPEPVLRLLHPSGEILLPSTERDRPHPAFLEYHRNHISKNQEARRRSRSA